MRSGQRITAAVAGIALCCPVALGAKEQSAKEIAHVRQVAAAFGDCVVKRSAPVARAVILGNLHDGQIQKSAYRLIDGNCLVKANDGMGAMMKFTGDLFRYTMAQALVRMDYPVERAFDFSNATPLLHLTPDTVSPELAGGTSRKAKKAVQNSAKEQMISALSKYGECVSRQAPGDVHAVLLSPLNSRQEYDAFGKLAEPLGVCLSEGQLKFSREVLRGVLALNFYRLAGAPAGAQVATLKVTH